MLRFCFPPSPSCSTIDTGMGQVRGIPAMPSRSQPDGMNLAELGEDFGEALGGGWVIDSHVIGYRVTSTAGLNPAHDVVWDVLQEQG